jgi:uncharacterized MnhB-related membrane protein
MAVKQYSAIRFAADVALAAAAFGGMFWLLFG